METIPKGPSAQDDVFPDEIRVATPTLSVYTPTFRRPTYLKICQASVAAQTRPTEHVIVRDEVGLGVGGMYRDIRNHAHRVHGQYVLVLSDDNVLLDRLVSEDLHVFVGRLGYPPVVMWRGHLSWSRGWFPFPWERRPVLNQVDLSCFVVRRDVWQANKDAWPDEYAADFYFIDQLWRDGQRFEWFDRTAYLALTMSQGKPE